MRRLRRFGFPLDNRPKPQQPLVASMHIVNTGRHTHQKRRKGEPLSFTICFRAGGRCLCCTGTPATAHGRSPVRSPTSTTTHYDGTYIRSFTENMSASGSGCPNFPVAPHLTIENGVARFAALDITYQGYVTPQGEVRMQSPAGQTFVGQNRSLLYAQRPDDRRLRL